MNDRGIFHDRLEGISVICLRGEADFVISKELEQFLGRLMATGEHNVIVDLSDSGFVSSATVGVLIGSAGRFRHAGGEMRICSVPPQAQEVFSIVGLDKFVAVYSDRTGALLACPGEIRSQLGVEDRRRNGDRRKVKIPIQWEDRRQSDRRHA